MNPSINACPWFGPVITSVSGCAGSNVGGILGPGKKEEWVNLRTDLETHTDQWLNLAVKCLNLIQSRPESVNVIVTQTQVQVHKHRRTNTGTDAQTLVQMHKHRYRRTNTGTDAQT